MYSGNTDPVKGAVREAQVIEQFHYNATAVPNVFLRQPLFLPPVIAESFD